MVDRIAIDLGDEGDDPWVIRVGVVTVESCTDPLPKLINDASLVNRELNLVGDV